jgi:hypothetical protein
MLIEINHRRISGTCASTPSDQCDERTLSRCREPPALFGPDKIDPKQAQAPETRAADIIVTGQDGEEA